MTGKTVAILAGPEYEDLELWYPKLRLEAAGYEAPIVGFGESKYLGKWGYPASADLHIRDVNPDTLLGVMVPGGWAPDKMRRVPEMLECVRTLNVAGKLVATICHGPWVLISANIVRGRKLTSTVGIKDDVMNAGAEWVNEAVVVDGNIITSRVPSDLPAFGEAIVSFLNSQ